MGFIIAFEHKKGGVGKTTTTINLACGLQVIEKLKVQILDRDNSVEGSSTWWNKLQNMNFPEVISMPPTTNYKVIASIADRKNVDITIIDGPAGAPFIENPIRAAHTLIIPLQTSDSDVKAITKLIPLIEERHTINDGKYPKVAFLITMDEKHTSLSKGVKEVLDEFKVLGNDVPLLETRITRLQIYKKAWGEGLSVFHINSNSKEVLQAKDEYKRLILELKERGFLYV